MFTYFTDNFNDENLKISYNQTGFRKNFRTADNIFTLKTLVDKSLKNKEKLYTCFVDFSKAYDTIWRTGLFYKMLKMGLPNNFVRLVKSMYSSLSAQIASPHGLSKGFPSLVGVKQGCNLSPTLFNIFINDLIKLCDQTANDSPDLDGVRVSCLLYADDLVLISRSKNGLQNLLNTLDDFCTNWFMKVNLKKTKCLIFAQRRLVNITFKLGGFVVENCEHYVFLGTVINWNGSFKKAMVGLAKKASGASFSLTNNILKFKACTFPIILKLFDSLISPIVRYNCEIWGSDLLNYREPGLFEFNSLSSTIESIHLKFLRYILKLPKQAPIWALFTETGRFPLKTFIYTHMVKYWYYLLNSESSILQAALKCSMQLHSQGYKSWFTGIHHIQKNLVLITFYLLLT